MRRLILFIAVLAALSSGMAGCGFPSLPGSGGGGSSSSGALWPDVPHLPGATQVDVELPLPVKMLVKGVVSAAQSGNQDGQDAKDWDYKVYQAAGSGTDVGTFYSQAAMSAGGWTQGTDSCGSSSPVAGLGSLCLFTKPAADGYTENLAILLMPGEGDNGTDQVAYVRFSSKGGA